METLRSQIQNSKQRSADDFPSDGNGKDKKERHVQQDLTEELFRQAAEQAAKEKKGPVLKDDDHGSGSEDGSEKSELFEVEGHGSGAAEAVADTEEDDYENGGDSPPQHGCGRGGRGRGGRRGRGRQPQAPKADKVKKPKKNRPSQKIMAKDRCTGHTILHPYPFF